MITGMDAYLRRLEAGVLSEGELYSRERAVTFRPVRRGGHFNCPICGTSSAKFLPFGLFRRPRALCPVCGSVERHRFLWLYLQQHTTLLRGRHRVLHTAPERCLSGRLRSLPNLHYRSVDRFDPAADIQADLGDLPLHDGEIDVVITSHVLEHIPDDRRAMAELARVLRPGGTAIVMVPFDPKMPETDEDPAHDTPAKRMAAYGHPFHYRIYGADLPDRLAAAGLSASRIDSRRMLTPHQRRFHRVNRNYLFACRKQA